MRANDQATKEHIEALEADNDSLRVEVQLLKDELRSWKSMAMVMQADRDCDFHSYISG